MTYQEFKIEYNNLLNQMFKYDSDQTGSIIFAEKIGKLVDEYPEFEKQLEEE